MKKRYLFLICFALLFFLGICFMSVKKVSAFLYPTPEQFADIISRSGLEQWTLKDAGTELEGSAESIYSEARRYELCNQGQRICCQFLLYRSHVETIGLNIHFLPANMSFYQKAVLTDEKGSIAVYIAPTALSQEELLSRRLHIVQAVQNANHETCYVITQSSLIK